MRVPLSWLREHAKIPQTATARDVAERLISAGLEVETVDHVGADVKGPLVVGRVLAFDKETHSNGKTIRWCRVDVGDAHNESATPELPAGRGIVCGALNFAVGDLVVVSLPGAVLPGGFAISARRTYGHVSDGMICSARELDTGDDASGIIVLPPDSGAPGDDAVVLLQLRDDVLDIAVTPDRGYCLSIRGVARETATAFGVEFVDPGDVALSDEATTDWPVEVLDTEGCDRFVTRSVAGLDVRTPSPLWMQRRLQLCGMRSISLAVDITNYVMLELGQPLHAYDRQRLAGPIVVRSAVADESVTTLDDVRRTLNEDDLLITEDSGPIGIAGVMGGATTEINDASTDIVIESAHFNPLRIARAARRHKLPSEASRRFERGVDPALQEAAAERAVRLLEHLGGATVLPGRTVVSVPRTPTTIELPLDLPTIVTGADYPHQQVVDALRAIGAHVEHDETTASVTVPSWRPDLVAPIDLVEEVARLQGYDTIPSVLPTAPAGTGYTESQRLRRRIGLTLAGAGYVEVHVYPFVATGVGDQLMWPANDPRRRSLRLANPLSDEEPALRTSLLPGLLSTLRRNVGRGFDDVALFELGQVFLPREMPIEAPQVGVTHRPTDDQLAMLDALLPAQPRHLAAAACGRSMASGWWGSGEPVTWGDAIEAARVAVAAAGLSLEVAAADHAPWHPGRCAALLLGGTVIGYAGEIHPRVVAQLGLPERTVAMELDLEPVLAVQPSAAEAPDVGTFPVAKEDIAVVVPDAVPASEVRDALVRGVEGAAPGLLESVRLFDVFTGDQVPEGRKSLAFALRIRAPDRTLTVAEVSAARAAALAEAERAVGAELRS